MGIADTLLSDINAGSQLGIFRPRRAIGQFATQVTLEERHLDELVITDHPVEQGADITDHAYRRPSEVVIRCGFSNSSIASLTTQIASLNLAAQNFTLPLGSNIALGGLNYANQIYQQLLALQASRIPFGITTGKRSYESMLIKSIEVETDRRSENTLMVILHCRQIILVETGIIQVANTNGQDPTPVNALDANPVADVGVKQLSDASPSPGGASPPDDWDAIMATEMETAE